MKRIIHLRGTEFTEGFPFFPIGRYRWGKRILLCEAVIRIKVNT
jgi:hypothetical protein